MKVFTLTKEHIALLQNLNITEINNVPAVSSKRPFGNSDWMMDAAKILGFKIHESSDGEQFLEQEEAEKIECLMWELPEALSIVLRTGSFEPKMYEADLYYDNWRPVS